ncbi:hypothetical protein IH992_03800 [Candidatus Poribacteria bacterium]|nr:hypothetical protein [Candidatus Poribacteria bacterium]
MILDHRGNPISTDRKLSLGARAIAGGRLSMDKSNEILTTPLTITSPTSPDETWRTFNLDSKTLNRISASRLMELLTDLSPEVSRALWDFLRFCNPGFTLSAMVLGSDDMDANGQAALDAFMDHLVELYGSVDIVFNRLFFAAFLRGAFFAELVLDEAGTTPIDIATPDPNSARFRKVNDPERGQIWELGQWQGGKWVALDRETIGYVPVDPFPGSPYGRPLATPALFSSLFLLGMFHDLRRVIAQQGYPRLDLELNLEELEKAMPADLESDPKKVKEWVSETLDEVSDVYSALEPDDAYVHTSVIQINRPVGTMNGSSLGAVDGLIRGLERMATRALKSMPLLMGSNEGVSETHANRQWEIHVAGIKSIQHLCETLMGRLFTLALQAQGIQAEAVLRFAELRASEELRDAQTENQKIINAQNKYLLGWISQDQASEEVTEKPADVPEPRAIPESISTIEGSSQSINGDMRFALRASSLQSRISHRVQITPEGASDPLPEVPISVGISDTEIERALGTWNKLMTDHKDLLSAKVENQIDFDDDIPTIIIGDWIFNQDTKRYRNPESGKSVTQRQAVTLRDDFIAFIEFDPPSPSQQLAKGDMTIQEWELEMRKRIKQSYLDEFALGKGGRNNLTTANLDDLGNLLKRQFDFLHNFAEQIKNGELSEAQIQNRSNQYLSSSTQAYELGKTASFGMPTLPQYPADGSQQCRSNCKCKWEIEEDEEEWRATWVLNPAAEHCETCEGNAQRWNPLVVRKSQARTRDDLATLLAADHQVVRRGKASMPHGYNPTNGRADLGENL